MKKLLLVTAASVVGMSSAFAEGVVTIPETGVDVAGFISAGITTMGTIAAVAIGGYVAFLCVRKGLRWLRSAF